MGNKYRSVREKAVTRREFLYVSALAVGGTVLAACGGNTNQANNNGGAGTGGTSTTGGNQAPTQSTLPGSPTEAPKATQPAGGTSVPSPRTVATQGAGGQATAVSTVGGAAPSPAAPKSFKESPELSKMVKAGKLPAVSERLPKNPIVIEPLEKVGTYGGTWNIDDSLGNDGAFYTRLIGYENLMRFTPDFKSIIPGVAESVESKSGGAEYTFKLREGMKWSDGKPFTADDIMFWYNDVLSNKDLTPSVSPWLLADGKPVKVEKVDDYTVTFKFVAPNGLLLANLAQVGGNAPTSYPAHYLKQFHKKYNPKVVQEAKKQKLEDWTDLFGQKADQWGNKEMPTLFAWTMTQPPGANTTQVIAERNPFYWKVDTEGNQLPYIDRVVYKVVNKNEIIVLDAANGEIDMQSRYVATNDNKPVLYNNQKKGSYHFFNTTTDTTNNMSIMLNLTHTDKAKRELFQNKNFRIGLSYAINRKDIIDVVWVSQGEPWQVAPPKGSVLYNEQLAKQYTEYSVDKANEYLDKVLPKKDGQGRRLGSDGKPIEFVFEFPTNYWADGAQPLTMVAKYWSAVGITADVKAVGSDLWSTHINNNQFDCTVWGGEGGFLYSALLLPRFFMPVSGSAFWANPWGNWYQSGGKEGVKPVAAAKKQMDLYDKVQATPDQGEQIDLMKQILQIAQEEFWIIGTMLNATGYGLVKNNFHNVPKHMPQVWLYPTPAPTNTCQYFMDDKK